MRQRARRLGVVLAALVVAGCVHYPNIADVGGTQIVPRNGHAARDGAQLLFFVDIESTGKYGDVLAGIQSPVADSASLVTGTGEPLGHVDVPGATVVRLVRGGPHGVLANLKNPVKPGDVIMVTLLFQKSGAIGVITVVD